MSLRFGVLTFQALPFPRLLDDVRFVEALGLDAVWLGDQTYPETEPILEAWTSLAALACGTERIRIGSSVTNVAMRNPMILARQVLTVDQISNGRLDVGLGAGWYDVEHTSIGVDFPDGKGRLGRLTEVAEILDQALRGGRVTYSGELYRIADAIANPPPTQQPRPPLWIAANARGSMTLAARLAEGTATYSHAGLTLAETVPVFTDSMRRLDELCLEGGRDPLSLRRSYLTGIADEVIHTSRDAMTDFIGRFSEAGATDLIFTFFYPSLADRDAGVRAGRFCDRRSLEILAADVIPQFRADARPAA
ncbi:MAG: LLM class flavin-dependent oxidoreductase [Candidatus Dormibacteraeota bacterium]|nr:LLM class flavin-dependent oxidoreductase [Candidatus Dormibacteraeota bacterium]